MLGSVFICAACGLVYELELVALASYLIGDAVTQTSVVLSVMVFAMGIGSLLAKRLRRKAAAGFGVIEVLLAAVGGGSAMAMYAYFAWIGPSRWVLVGFSLVIGVLIGAEMPLLMTLIQRIRAQDAGGAVADLFAADYVGALLGGLAFPFLLLPCFGQLTGALLTGLVNAVAGGVVVLWLFRSDLTRRSWLWLLAGYGALIVLLVAGGLGAGHFERAARQAVYGGEVRAVRHTADREVVLTGSAGAPSAPDADPVRPSLRLYLDGRLQVNSADEARYHDALVHPALAGPPRSRVLILGGGNGLALREVLRYPDVAAVTVLVAESGVAELARGDPGLAALNRRAFADPRVHLVTADVFEWLRNRATDGSGRPRWDVIVSDLPDPGAGAGTKLFSQEFFGLAQRLLTDAGRLAVHVDGSAPAKRGNHALWTAEATLRAAGLATAPYLVDGRVPARAAAPGSSDLRSGCRSASPRHWGFILAGLPGGAGRPPLRLAADGPVAPRALTSGDLRAAARRAERARPAPLPPSTLLHPRYPGCS